MVSSHFHTLLFIFNHVSHSRVVFSLVLRIAGINVKSLSEDSKQSYD